MLYISTSLAFSYKSGEIELEKLYKFSESLTLLTLPIFVRDILEDQIALKPEK